jgi:hypothetical protein
MGTPPHSPADRPPLTEAERERLKRDFWEIYCDGARCAFSLTFPGPRTADGFPCGFPRWRADWRNAWLLGFDLGFHDRQRAVAELRRLR